MFDQPKRAVLGVALLSGVTAGGMVPASAGAAPLRGHGRADQTPAPSATVSAGSATPRQCVSWALPPRRLLHGERNPMACAGTLDEARSALDLQLTASGEPLGDGGSYSTTALGGGNLLATHYDDPFAAIGASWQVWADNCGDAVARPPDYIDGAISSTVMGICSKSKQFTGYDFTGDYYPRQSSPGGYFSLPGSFDNRIHSIRYG